MSSVREEWKDCNPHGVESRVFDSKPSTLRELIQEMAYMDCSGRRQAGQKGVAIEMGVTAVHRVVDGRYEWRDAGLTAVGDRDDA